MLADKTPLCTDDAALALKLKGQAVLNILDFLSQQGLVAKSKENSYSVTPKGFLALNYFGYPQQNLNSPKMRC